MYSINPNNWHTPTQFSAERAGKYTKMYGNNETVEPAGSTQMLPQLDNMLTCFINSLFC